MRRFLSIPLALFAITLPSAATAGPYADDLAKCLVSSTTENDRIQLVRWMFSAASLHPAVEPISSVTAADLDAANKTIADLVVKLLTDSCRAQTKDAIKYEGSATLETAFSVLGQVAGQELFTSPEVAAAMAGLEHHMDAEKLGELAE